MEAQELDQALKEVSLNDPTTMSKFSSIAKIMRKVINNEPLPKESFSIPDKPPITKSEEMSIKYFEMGEKALFEDDNIGALKAFTTALCLAPAFSKMIAHCYFWRSVALQNITAFPESLQDIERALQIGITEKQEQNSLKRRKMLEKLILNESIRKLQIKPDESSQEELTLSYGENPEIPGVSSAMALVFNEEFGRHYVATQDIKIGDILMIQKPYVFVPRNEGCSVKEGKKWICDFCLKLTLAPIPCDSCTTFFYCSFECRSEAYEKYHETECKIVNVQPYSGPRTAIFLRTLIMATNHGVKLKEIFNVITEVQTNKDRRTFGFKDGKFDASTINAVLSLTAHNDNLEPHSNSIINTAKLIAALQKNTNFFKTHVDDSSLVKLIFLSYICSKNLYTIRQNNYKNRIAYGIYPGFSLINHSCECNAFAYDDKQWIKILRACRDIKKGEQIFMSYLTYNVLNLTAAQRKSILLENQCFICQCDACKRNYAFQPELKGHIKVPERLERKLFNKPNDIEILWELLKLIVKEKDSTFAAKVIELALVNAYMGADNKDVFEILKTLRPV